MAKAVEQRREIKVKVAAKGGISVYGLGQRYPVTLYRDMWHTLKEVIGGVCDFADAKEAECNAIQEKLGGAAKGTVDETGRVTL